MKMNKNHLQQFELRLHINMTTSKVESKISKKDSTKVILHLQQLFLSQQV